MNAGRLNYSMSVTADGYAAAPDGSLDWVWVDEELTGLQEHGRHQSPDAARDPTGACRVGGVPLNRRYLLRWDGACPVEADANGRFLAG